MYHIIIILIHGLILVTYEALIICLVFTLGHFSLVNNLCIKERIAPEEVPAGSQQYHRVMFLRFLILFLELNMICARVCFWRSISWVVWLWRQSGDLCMVLTDYWGLGMIA